MVPQMKNFIRLAGARLIYGNTFSKRIHIFHDCCSVSSIVKGSPHTHTLSLSPDQNVYHARTHLREERGNFLWGLEWSLTIC